MKNIVLIGMPACGKSTIGVILAKTLGFDFIDTDLIIQQREKRLLQDIIDNDGLQEFLDIECNSVLSLDVKNSIIATGGSVVFRECAMAHLKKNSTIIFIDVSIQTLKDRLNNIKTRGIAAKQTQTIDEIFNERMPLYKKYADFTLNLESKNIEEAVSMIISLIKKN
ncbi:MAG: shikimate kinase [Oscillospiraceae bacterium]